MLTWSPNSPGVKPMWCVGQTSLINGGNTSQFPGLIGSTAAEPQHTFRGLLESMPQFFQSCFGIARGTFTTLGRWFYCYAPTKQHYTEENKKISRSLFLDKNLSQLWPNNTFVIYQTIPAKRLRVRTHSMTTRDTITSQFRTCLFLTNQSLCCFHGRISNNIWHNMWTWTAPKAIDLVNVFASLSTICSGGDFPWSFKQKE